ncbi:isochorismatase family protein [Arthrobacter sp. HS15c]|uniref:isochorismatase family protein n=1 Tax=Arthrobacter sp. HS15c TaxID=3230279 RepID=UPI0034662BFA
MPGPRRGPSPTRQGPGGPPRQTPYPPHQESLPMIARAVDAATAAGIPIAVIQHSAGVGAPVFAPGTPEFDLHPVIEGRKTGAWKSVVKQYGSVYAGTDLAAWLWKHDVDTVTLMGYMTNNCVLASAVEADTAAWTEALVSRQALTRSDLGSSAVARSQLVSQT